MDWDDVRVFYAVARARSLAAGARAAQVDRSTASRRIASLERVLRARLFLRTRDGLRLSAAGERLLVHAERMEHEARTLRASADDDGTDVRGVVRVATTESLAAMLVREEVLSIRARHPHLVIELLGENRVLDLARGEADLALRISKVSEPSLRVKRVALLPFAVFASESYVRRRGRPTSIEGLDGHEIIAYAGPELSRLPEARWATALKGVHTALRTNSVVAMLAATQAGLGVSVIAGSWVERNLGLVRLFDLDVLPPRPLWLVMHPDAAARPAVRVVADHIATLVGRGSRPVATRLK